MIPNQQSYGITYIGYFSQFHGLCIWPGVACLLTNLAQHRSPCPAWQVNFPTTSFSPYPRSDQPCFKTYESNNYDVFIGREPHGQAMGAQRVRRWSWPYGLWICTPSSLSLSRLLLGRKIIAFSYCERKEWSRSIFPVWELMKHPLPQLFLSTLLNHWIKPQTETCNMPSRTASRRLPTSILFQLSLGKVAFTIYGLLSIFFATYMCI
jgi:hypothetical protein